MESRTTTTIKGAEPREEEKGTQEPLVDHNMVHLVVMVRLGLVQRVIHNILQVDHLGPSEDPVHSDHHLGL